MNALELKMVDVLKRFTPKLWCSWCEGEFEAEGTRLEEAMRLKEVVSKSGALFDN